MTTYSNVAEVATIIGRGASLVANLGNVSASEALLIHCATIVTENVKVQNRTGTYSAEMSSDMMEDWGFMASVAADILDGTVDRPSTGNVRKFARQVLTDTLAE